MKRALRELSEFYMIDLSCDEDLRPFYESMSMKKTLGMMHRNYEKQSGK